MLVVRKWNSVSAHIFRGESMFLFGLMTTSKTFLFRSFKTIFEKQFHTCLGLQARPVKVPPQSIESAYPIYDPWFENSPRGPQPRTKTGSRFTITLIPGVGIGEEMLEACMEVFECCGAPIVAEWIHEYGSPDSLELMKCSLSRNGIAIKGNIESRSTMEIVNSDIESWNFLLNEMLDLYVRVTEIKSFRGLEKHMRMHKNVDLIVIRSNTEGEYSLLEHEPYPGVCEHMRVISSYNTRRVSDFAFRLAKKKGRRKVSVLHQKFTMPMSEGLFVEEFLKVAAKYPEIDHEVADVHNAIHTMYKQLENLDVIVSNSIYCSQLVDLLTGMIGGPRLVAGGSFSEKFAVFQPSINSRSRGLVGKCEANPTAYILCGAHLLDYLGYQHLAKLIRDSIEVAYVNGVKTKDMGGKATTKEFVAEVVKHIQTEVPKVLCKYDKPKDIKPVLPKEWAPEKSGLFFDGSK